MQNKNFDGIHKKKTRPVVRVSSREITAQPRTVRVPIDGLQRSVAVPGQTPKIAPRKPLLAHTPVPAESRRAHFPALLANPHRLLAPLTAMFILVAFAAGMNFAQQTPKIAAEDITAPPGVAAHLGNAPTSTDSTITNAVLFNTPLELLQNYFTSSSRPGILAERKEKLRQFLADHNSPFTEAVDTLAEQPHFKLILAISFAESTMGKKCYKFNCSGIGGANIREYKSYANWMLDLNRLIEKRYKDWTLKEMCGVYVKPCNPHWLVATQQILKELDNIE